MKVSLVPMPALAVVSAQSGPGFTPASGGESSEFSQTSANAAPAQGRGEPNGSSTTNARVGTIESVVEVPDSDKLVRLTVDFGDRKRAVLVGLKKERPDPTAIAGKQALFVVNLLPRKMMGEVSEGRLLDIGYADGIDPVLAEPERAVPSGTRAC